MKVYEKPMLIAESFVLSEHIADRCALDMSPENERNGTPNHGNSSNCSFSINNGSVNLFIQGVTLSNDCLLDSSQIDRIECYNNFTDMANLFSS